MASKLTRFTQKLFGSAATTNQIAQFGSLAASAPQRYSGATVTPALIQALSNFLTGWFGASVGANSPAEEDMNALFYLAFYQLCYLLQEGVAEYDSGTTYFVNSQVQSGGIVYTCIFDNSGSGQSGNAPPNQTYWAQQVQNGSVYPQTISTNTTTQANTNTMLGPTTVNTGETVTVASASTLCVLRKLILSGTAALVVSGTGSVIIY